MTNKEILYNAILKAEKNGWKNPYDKHLFCDTFYPYNDKTVAVNWDVVLDYEKQGLIITNNHPGDSSHMEVSVSHIIFSNSFAKAFFGFFDGPCGPDVDGERYDYTNKHGWPVVKRDYRYHLQEMVLCERPLKYLEKFLK